MIERATGLGVRPLPLLSADAEASAVADGVDQAIQQLGEKVFDQDWLAAQAAAEAFESDSASWDDEYPYTYGVLDPVVARAIGSQEPGESVDLAGLLLIGGQSGYTLGYAILQGLADIQPNCDTKLGNAHAISLRWGAAPDVRERGWAEAVAACGDDPTAEYYRGISALVDGFARGCGNPTVAPADGRQDILKGFQSIQTKYPTAAAGFVGEGEVQLAQALEAQQRGLRPFWVTAQLTAAGAAFETAASLSSDQEIVRAIARTQLAAGEYADATRTMAPLVAGGASVSDLEVAAEAAARSGGLGTAADLAVQAESGSSTGLPWRELIYTAIDLPEEARAMTGLEDVQQPEHLINGGGCGPSLTNDSSFVPPARQTADSRLDGYSQSELYAVLLPHPLEGLDPLPGEELSISRSRYDERQNLLRQWGLYEQAADVSRAWIETYPGDALAYDRLGEALFLAEDYNDAREAFDTALGLPDAVALDSWHLSAISTERAWRTLRSAASAMRAEAPHEEAVGLLEAAASWAPVVDELGLDDSSVRFYALSLLGELAYDDGDIERCLTLTEQAIDVGQQYEANHQGLYLLRGAEEQRASVAAAKLANPQAAVDWANAALARDPENPLFLETVAEAERLGRAATPEPAEGTANPSNGEKEGSTTGGTDEISSGGLGTVIAHHEETVRTNDSFYSSWNNLGALYWQQGSRAKAEDAFKHAVAARPGYATGWFNLGVAWSEVPGFVPALAAQGAFAKAARLNPELRGADPDVLLDDVIYKSGIDLSGVVTRDWQLAQTVEAPMPRVTIAVAGLLLLRVVLSLGADSSVGRLTEAALTRGANSKNGLLARLQRARPHWAWMFMTSAASATWLPHPRTWIEWLLVGLTTVAVLAVYMRIVTAVSRPGVASERATWPPGIAVTAIATAATVGFAPPPTVREGQPASVLHVRTAVTLLGVLTATYITAAVFSGVPAPGLVAAAVFLVLASALVPVRPIDGAFMPRKAWASALVTVGLAAGALIIGMGWA